LPHPKVCIARLDHNCVARHEDRVATEGLETIETGHADHRNAERLGKDRPVRHRRTVLDDEGDDAQLPRLQHEARKQLREGDHRVLTPPGKRSQIQSALIGKPGGEAARQVSEIRCPLRQHRVGGIAEQAGHPDEDALDGHLRPVAFPFDESNDLPVKLRVLQHQEMRTEYLGFAGERLRFQTFGCVLDLPAKGVKLQLEALDLGNRVRWRRRRRFLPKDIGHEQVPDRQTW
jgi:hypothetical protein